MENGNLLLNNLKESEFVEREGIVVGKIRKDKRIVENKVVEKTMEMGWLTQIKGEDVGGIYVYHKPMAKLIRAFQNRVLKLAEDHGFEEQIFPRHYELSGFINFGWVDEDFHGEDTGNSLTRELMEVKPFLESDGRTNHKLIIDTVQCMGFYTHLSSLQDELGGKLPDVLFDKNGLRMVEYLGGWTFRNELKDRLSKGWVTGAEFGGMEIVFAGLRDQVYMTRWEMLLAVVGLLDELGMKYRIVIGGSCSRDMCCSTKGKKFSLYEIPTIDIEVFVGENGVGKEWIEIGGGDIAGTRLTGNFGLRLKSGKDLYSGCQGVGWQRIAFGFLAQFGLNYKNWPKSFFEWRGVKMEDWSIGDKISRYLTSKWEKVE